MKKFIWTAIATIAFIYALGIVGSYDYADEVVYSMSETTYNEIIKKIGKSSNKEVAAEYFNNRQYYDSIK